jgi:predicted MFS family arabinose efflux permease
MLLGVTLLPASLIGGLLYDKVNSGAPFYFGAITSFIAAILMLAFIVKNKKDDRLTKELLTEKDKSLK